MGKQEPNIFLLGSTGQLGYQLHSKLTKLGKVLIPDRKKFSFEVPELLRKELKNYKPDIIVNAAAYTAVDKAESEHEKAFKVNTEAPKILAEEAERRNIPLVHFSTDYVFDGTKSFPYTEKDSTDPVNVYGLSKLLGEQEIQRVSEKFLIIRTSWVYSQIGNNFLNTMLKLLNTKNEVRVVDDQEGSPTCTSNIADLTVTFLEKMFLNNIEPNWGLYNLTAAGRTTWYDFAKKIKLMASIKRRVKIIPVSTEDYATQAKRPKMSLLDNSKINKELGIKQMSWEYWLKREINNNEYH
jgi:dTDP-4-dehydrorhamnose reductase